MAHRGTIAWRKKISVASRGKKLPAVAEANRNRVISDATRAKLGRTFDRRTPDGIRLAGEKIRRSWINGTRKVHGPIEPCDICGGRQRWLKSLCKDHDHRTGRLRGLLCDRCNRCIGLFQDDPSLLIAASIYLKKWREIHGV